MPVSRLQTCLEAKPTGGGVMTPDDVEQQMGTLRAELCTQLYPARHCPATPRAQFL